MTLSVSDDKGRKGGGLTGHGHCCCRDYAVPFAVSPCAVSRSPDASYLVAAETPRAAGTERLVTCLQQLRGALSAAVADRDAKAKQKAASHTAKEAQAMQRQHKQKEAERQVRAQRALEEEAKAEARRQAAAAEAQARDQEAQKQADTLKKAAKDREQQVLASTLVLWCRREVVQRGGGGWIRVVPRHVPRQTCHQRPPT